MSQKNYVSLSRLSTFLDNLSTKFAALIHKHSISDITDYTVDSDLSSTSANPVQNKVIDAEFEAIGHAMNVLEDTIDGKADANHNHDDKYYTETEVDAMLDGKSDKEHYHHDMYYPIAEINVMMSDKASIHDIPTAVSELTNDAQYATKEYVDAQIGSTVPTNHTHSSEDIILTDTITGAQYRLYITNGKLNIVLDGEIPESAYSNGDEVMY